MSWGLADVPDLTGKTVVVTGANAGIGYATAVVLARKGASVVLGCRDAQKGEKALLRLRSEVKDCVASLVALDLASLESIRDCSVTLQRQLERIDVLVNNAGVMMPPLGRTADGFETQFGTNVLGHYALTGRLLPLLRAAPAARVVTLGSVAHWRGKIDFADLNAERTYDAWKAYAQSKLANIVYAYELQRRCSGRALTISSLAAHPGGTQSDLGRHRLLLRLLSPLAQSVQMGALPSVRAAVDPQARGGEYYGPSGLLTFSGPPARQRSSAASQDETLGRELWRVCGEMTGIRYFNE